MTVRARAFCNDADITAEADGMDRRHNAGYGADLAPYRAANCVDRGAALAFYFGHHEHLLANKLVGHVPPEAVLRDWFVDNKTRLPCGYVTMDGFQNGMDAYVDLVETLLPEQMFDVLICHRVLEHVLDDHGALKELFRILKPGGLMLHMELPPSNMTDDYYNFYLDWDAFYNNEPHYAAFRNLDFAKTLQDSGFEKDKLAMFRIPNFASTDPKEFSAVAKGEETLRRDHGGGAVWFTFGGWK